MATGLQARPHSHRDAITSVPFSTYRNTLVLEYNTTPAIPSQLTSIDLFTMRRLALYNQRRIWYRKYDVASLSTNQNCPFR